MKVRNIEVVKKGPRTKDMKIFELLIKMKPGAYTILNKKDWHYKASPGAYMIRERTGREFQVQSLVDGSGWKITAM